MEITEATAAELLGLPKDRLLQLLQAGIVPAREVSPAEQMLAGSPARWRIHRYDVEQLRNLLLR